MPVRDWTPAQRALMRWLCLPGDDKLGEGRGLKDPKTLTALAQKLGYSRETLYDWQDLPGWDEALAVMAKQVTVDLEPEYLKNLSVAMMKPEPNDRLVTAYWRYIYPILHDEKDRGAWNNILPETTMTGQIDISRLISEGMRLLPLEYRELLLNSWSQILNGQDTGIMSEQEKYRVRRMTTEAEEKSEAKELAKEQESNIVELRVLPAPGQIVDGQTAGELPRIADARKYKPKRKSKESYW